MWLRWGSNCTSLPRVKAPGCISWGWLLGGPHRKELSSPRTAQTLCVPYTCVEVEAVGLAWEGEPGGNRALLTAAHLQLPVPLAVLFLLSKERLLTCCPQRRPLLLSADELALETQPPEKEDASSLPPKCQPHQGRGSRELLCSQPHTEASLGPHPQAERRSQVIMVGKKHLGT